MDYILSLYGCIFLIGVLANGSLTLALCCGPGVRTRSPLLLGLISADLLVCCLSGPITAALCTFTSWTQTWYHIALFAQAWPVAASTLSMMAVSIDRYLTVKNYRPASQVVGRRYLLTTVVCATWFSAAVLSTVQFIPRTSWRRSLILIRLVLVHITPASAVLISHFGVHAKLTALSLTARAKHGELPLPMPLLRRPTHVIIVAGITKSKNGNQKVQCDVEDENQPPRSTLRSRRRLANSLLWVSAIFTMCWLPHVVCEICVEFDSPPSDDVQRYSLLLGHIHSALSPVFYWTINHQWLHRPCKFRWPGYRSASSTNEAALGPFNPRYARPPPIRRRSSHYLY